MHIHTPWDTHARRFYIVVELCCGDLPSLLEHLETVKAYLLGAVRWGTIAILLAMP